ncbi:hypothetical protein CCMSSC00406_0006527 [Pleurotus cornucopiae]|uniref:Uncharacterized protein n=1 Tax=Pleurotus cornucopiae TaxID=5321 RepID=A0ACB7IVS4_PLECO|nr:hypothetical protein CCMSSC00406_0006527 [Pleurotus cornucopiae]
MLRSALSLTATVLGAITLVNAHGYVQEVTLDTTVHSGYLPYSDPYYPTPPQRIVRKIPGNGPVEDVSSIDVQCNGWAAGGFTTAPAPIYGTIEAGKQVKLDWTTWPDSHVGPIITYMARVPSGVDITEWSPGTAAVWFKVAESGKTADGKWAATDGLYANDHIYTFTVPARLRPGQYIIRHEIIALHAAWSYPGAQVYPSCIQVEVTGNGNDLPTNLVSFPGEYTPTTPGLVYDVYTNTGPYPIPGPAVWS